jgi:hypothetical protein
MDPGYLDSLKNPKIVLFCENKLYEHMIAPSLVLNEVMKKV